MGMMFFSSIQLLESKFRNEVNNLEQKLTQLQSDVRDKDNQLQALKSQLNDKDNIIEVCENPSLRPSHTAHYRGSLSIYKTVEKIAAVVK